MPSGAVLSWLEARSVLCPLSAKNHIMKKREGRGLCGRECRLQYVSHPAHGSLCHAVCQQWPVLITLFAPNYKDAPLLGSLKPDGWPPLIYPNDIFTRPQCIGKPQGYRPFDMLRAKREEKKDPSLLSIQWCSVSGYCLIWWQKAFLLYLSVMSNKRREESHHSVWILSDVEIRNRRTVLLLFLTFLIGAFLHSSINYLMQTSKIKHHPFQVRSSSRAQAFISGQLTFMLFRSTV